MSRSVLPTRAGGIAAAAAALSEHGLARGPVQPVEQHRDFHEPLVPWEGGVQPPHAPGNP